MSTFALSNAFNLLLDNEQNGTPLLVTGFKVGDALNIGVSDSYTEQQGNLVFTGNNTNIKHVPYSSQIAILQLIIEHDQPELVVGNILIEVNNQPFAMYIPERIAANRKLQTNDLYAGIRYVLQVIIDIPQLTQRISFSNLASGLATFKNFNSITEVTPFYMTKEDQATIDEHDFLKRGIPLLNTPYGWYGNPLAMDITDTKYWKLSGGTIGDSYRYTKDQ